MEHAAHDWTRRDRGALVLLVCLMLASLFASVHPWYEAGDDTNDASIYIACARSMLAGEGYSYLGMPFTVRPPGVSALIAPILHWRGNDFFALNLLVSLFGVAGCALLFAFARERIGTTCAFALSAWVWLDSDFQRMCNQTMSDVPGVALLLAGLLIERWARRRPSWRRDLVLGLAIGISTYVRSITILLVPAILAARFFAQFRPERRVSWSRFVIAGCLPLVLATLLVKLPWDLRNAANQPELPVDQNFLFSYSTAMWHRDGGDPSSPTRPFSEIVERIPERVEEVGALLGSWMGTSESPGWMWVGLASLACVLIVAWKRREPAEFFVLGATFVLLIYFVFRERLILPLWVLSLPALVECAQWVLLRFFRLRRVSVLLGMRGQGQVMMPNQLGAAWPSPAFYQRCVRFTCASLVCVAGLAGFAWRADWDPIRAQYEHLAQLATDVNAQVPREERLAAPIGWHYSVFLDRPVWSLFFGARRERQRGGSEADGIEKVLSRYQIDRVLLSSSIPVDRQMLPHFTARHGTPTLAGNAKLFDIRR